MPEKAWTRLTRRRMLVAAMLFALAAIGAIVLSPLGRYAGWAWRRVTGGATIEQRLAQYGPAARQRLRPHFDNAGIAYPPSEVVLVGIKDSKTLQLWARADQTPFMLVRSFPVLAASGRLGPKLREGDRQVPEGLYRVESLNPNSMFHLSLRLDYPNEFDRHQAKRDGRSNLGGDIMIHGSDASIGCLAMGDETAEELFVLATGVGLANVQVILTPVDLRTSNMPADVKDLPEWTDDLYREIRAALEQLVEKPGRQVAS